MSDAAERLKDQLLQLPAEDRAALANLLFDSLTTPRDAGWDAAWAAECDRRWEAAATGAAAWVPAKDVHREVRARLEAMRDE